MGEGESAVPLMNDATRQRVEGMFGQQLKDSVEILLFHTGAEAGEDQFAEATRDLLSELAAVAGGRLQVREISATKEPETVQTYGIERFPALVFLDQNGADQRIRFYGAPMGYEFTTLLDDIVDVSRQETRFSDAARAEIRGIDQEVLIQVFSTPG